MLALVVDWIGKLCRCYQTEYEYHFILCCPAFTYKHRKYFDNISWPNTSKFVSILSSNDSKLLHKTANYLIDCWTDALKLRIELLQRQSTLSVNTLLSPNNVTNIYGLRKLFERIFVMCLYICFYIFNTGEYCCILP